MNTLKIIYTPSVSKSYQLDFLKDRDPLMDETLVLVPEQFAFESEKYLVEAMGQGGLFNVQVYGFKKLVYEKAISVGIKTKNVLSPLGKELIVMSILKEINGDLRVYNGAFSSRKYAGAISKQLDSIRMDGLTSEVLIDMASNLNSSSNLISNKLHDLALILEKYSSYMTQSVVDEISLINQITNHYLSSSKYSNSIVVEGFTGMSNAEIDLIAAMASATTGDCFIRVLSAKNGVASRYSSKFIGQIKKAFSKIGEDLRVEELISTPSSSETRAFYFADIFDYSKPKVKVEADENFRVVSSQGRNQELDFVASDILRLMRTEKYEWEDFAVLTTDPALYKRYIESRFSKFKIPYFQDETISVSGFNHLAFIINSLRAVSSGFEYKNVVDTIKLRTFIRKSDVEDEYINTYLVASYIERHAMKFRISYNLWNKPEFWEKYFLEKFQASILGDLDPLYRNIISLKNEVMGGLTRLRDGLSKHSTISGKALALRKYLDEFSFFEILESEIESLKGDEDGFDYKKIRSIYIAVEEVLAQLESMSKNLVSDTQAFVDIVEHAFSSYKAGLTPPAKQTVVVGNIERTKLSSCKVLYIIGANEGLMPSPAPEGSAMFSSSEINLLDSFDFVDFKTNLKFMDKEVFDLYEKIVSASDMTVLTYSKTDEKKNGINPSSWVRGLLKKGCVTEEEFNLEDTTLVEAGVVEPYFENKIFNLMGSNLISPVEEIDFLEQDKVDDFISKFNSYTSAENLMRPKISKDLLSYYTAPLLKHSQNYRLSISKLETQAACPFKYYVSQILKPGRNFDRETDRGVMGNIIHRALEDFVREFLNSSDKENFMENAPSNLISEFRKSVLKEEVYNLNRSEISVLSVFENSLRNAARPILMQVDVGGSCSIEVKNEDAFLHLFKRGLSDKSGLDECSKAHKMELIGRIDRLDVIKYRGVDYIRIVDYKTGKTKFDLNKIRHGLQLQLSTYLEAVLDGYDSAKSVKPFGMFYTSLSESATSEKNDESRLKEIYRGYGLDGRFIDDEGILASVDKGLSEDGLSKISRVRFTSSGIDKRCPVMSEEEFRHIFEVSSENRWKLLDQILEADISISPYKDNTSQACNMCEYKSICKMDGVRYRDKFRSLK